MKSRMINEFGADKLGHFASDKTEFYVVDYTEKTDSARSVEVLETFPTDIDPLIVHNPNPLNITTTVFKPQCFMENGKELKQCEGVMYLTENTPESFVVFVEIKDCKPSRTYKYHQEIKEKIITNVELFRRKGLIPENKIVYAVASFPRKDKTDFHNQLIKNTERKQFREKYKVMIKGTNEITIKNSTSIK